MDFPPPFTLLVTAHHQGHLAYLARLQTYLHQVRAALETPCLLLDVGGAWSTQAWVCQATENRAPYLVMDAMGYAGAVADGLDAVNLERLIPLVQLQFIPPQTLFGVGGATARVDSALDQARVRGDLLELPMPPAYTLLRLTLRSAPLEILHSQIDQVGYNQMLPDPTITATIDFVEGEARYYQKKKGN
jgi:hypothetical protein